MWGTVHIGQVCMLALLLNFIQSDYNYGHAISHGKSIEAFARPQLVTTCSKKFSVIYATMQLKNITIYIITNGAS